MNHQPYGSARLRSKVHHHKQNRSTTFSITVPDATLDSLREEARAAGMSFGELLRRHLEILSWAHKMRTSAGREHPYRKGKP